MYMKPIEYIITILIVAAVSAYGSYLFLVKPVVVAPPAQQASVVTVPSTENANVKTITAGGVIEVKIPSDCETSGAAGSTYVICPTAGNPTPTPDAVISSDGQVVSIKRWEDQVWPFWDEFIASIRVKTPLTHEVTIKIQN